MAACGPTPAWSRSISGSLSGAASDKEQETAGLEQLGGSFVALDRAHELSSALPRRQPLLVRHRCRCICLASTGSQLKASVITPVQRGAVSRTWADSTVKCGVAGVDAPPQAQLRTTQSRVPWSSCGTAHPPMRGRAAASLDACLFQEGLGVLVASPAASGSRAVAAGQALPHALYRAARADRGSSGPRAVRQGLPQGRLVGTWVAGGVTVAFGVPLEHDASCGQTFPIWVTGTPALGHRQIAARRRS
jgi:hypothetical protein